MRLVVSLLLLSGVAAVWGGGNLLEMADLSTVDDKGVPVGYVAVARVPRGGDRLDADGLVAPDSDQEKGGIVLTLPEDRNLELDLEKALELEEAKLYRFEVKLRWEELAATGEGVAPFGACFIVYVHGTTSHRSAIIKPSGSSGGWVTLQMAFDVGRYPDLRMAKVFFRSKEIAGRVWIKDAVVEKVSELPSNATGFVLPSGEIVDYPVLSL